MTYEEYIKNPMGTHNAVFSARDMYAKMYTDKWNALKLREAGFVGYTMYNAGSDYIIHFKIPSEVVEKFYYDVIIRFFHKKDEGSKDFSRTLSDYDVQFFSNDPSFTYTFAHAFKKNKLLFEDLEGRMSKLSLTRLAKEKNPKDQVGYVKSLYFAYLEMKSLDMFNKSRWSTARQYGGKKMWLHLVEHADDKIKARQNAASAMSKKHKRTKQKEKKNQTLLQKVTHTFASPNISNFGHFKQNKMQSPNIKGFGSISRLFKKFNNTK